MTTLLKILGGLATVVALAASESAWLEHRREQKLKRDWQYIIEQGNKPDPLGLQAELDRRKKIEQARKHNDTNNQVSGPVQKTTRN